MYIFFLVTTLILQINVAYSRYFETYMPLSLYDEFNNLNGLAPNIKDAFEINDIIFIFTIIIVSITYRLTNKYIVNKNSLIFTLLFTFTTVAAFFFHYKSIKGEHKHYIEHFKDLNDQRTIWDIMIDKRKMLENNMPKTCVFYYGIGLSLFMNILEEVFDTEKYHFTDSETVDIKKHMYPETYYLQSDTVQNLILIIVESLSSWPINKSFSGIEITPNINKILSNSLYFPKMFSETLLGESSDGQFIYLTGLLPLKNYVTINEIRSSKIESFIRILKRQKTNLYCQMIIPTNNDAWSQKSMCQKYGIDTLFSKEDYNKKTDDEWLNDKELFEFASEKGTRLSSPFIYIILTSSMHSPYNKSFEECDIQYPKDFTPEQKHYLNNVHYMDKYLGEYLNTLKEQYLFNQSTIIITSDHKPNAPKLNANIKANYEFIPLIIINGPKCNIIPNTSSMIFQTSLFPSILDMYDVNSKWRGVGKSIFMPDTIRKSTFEKERQKKEHIISEYILSSKYLKGHP